MLSQPCHKLVLLQVRSHLLAVRFDRLELGGNDAAAHRDILVPIFHLAVDDASSGCMKLLRPGFRFDAGDVILPNSAPRHDDDAACRTFHQFGNERNPFHGIGLLAGSQDTVAAQLNQLLQCGKGIAANIKQVTDNGLAVSINRRIKGTSISPSFVKQPKTTPCTFNCLHSSISSNID